MYSVLLNIISTPCSAACKKPDLYRGTWQFFSYSISIFFVYKNPLKRGRGEEEFFLTFVSLPLYWFFSSPSAFSPFLCSSFNSTSRSTCICEGWFISKLISCHFFMVTYQIFKSRAQFWGRKIIKDHEQYTPLSNSIPKVIKPLLPRPQGGATTNSHPCRREKSLS